MIQSLSRGEKSSKSGKQITETVRGENLFLIPKIPFRANFQKNFLHCLTCVTFIDSMAEIEDNSFIEFKKNKMCSTLCNPGFQKKKKIQTFESGKVIKIKWDTINYYIK